MSDQKKKEDAADNAEKQTRETCENSAPPQEKTAKKTEKTPEELRAEELEKLKAELAEAQQKFLYLQAEFQNYRRRAAKDVSDARVLGTASALEPFLHVSDFLDMAQTAAEQSDNVAAIKQGVLMIIGEYKKAMDELGVVKFKSTGEPFDPALHDAVTSEPSESVPEGHVIREFAAGYKMGERLLRPARVVVSQGPEKPEPEKAPDSNENKTAPQPGAATDAPEKEA